MEGSLALVSWREWLQAANTAGIHTQINGLQLVIAMQKGELLEEGALSGICFFVNIVIYVQPRSFVFPFGSRDLLFWVCTVINTRIAFGLIDH